MELFGVLSWWWAGGWLVVWASAFQWFMVNVQPTSIPHHVKSHPEMKHNEEACGEELASEEPARMNFEWMHA